MPVNLDQLISVFEGASYGGRAAKPQGLGGDILTTLKSLKKDNSLFREEYRVCISSMLARLGVPDVQISIFLNKPQGSCFP